MKVCKKCDEEKQITDFYKHPCSKDGRDSTCKECRKSAVRNNYQKNREHYREYERKRAMLPHRVEMRERYQKTEAGKSATYRCKVKYRKKNPIKEQAHNRVNTALVDGRLVKAEACEACGDDRARLHGHHDDYLRQLDVRWLCPRCHKKWHDEHGEAANASHDPLPQFHMRLVSHNHGIRGES